MSVKIQQVNELSNIAKKSVERKKYENPDTIRKTSNDELKYLQSKFKGYSFVAADYKKGMKYGSQSTVNVAISPSFLRKMAKNPELEKKVESQLTSMKEKDDENIKEQSKNGIRVSSQGWAIDKSGNISKWTNASRHVSAKSISASAKSRTASSTVQKKTQTVSRHKSMAVNKFAWKTALSGDDDSSSGGIMSSLKKKLGL